MDKNIGALKNNNDDSATIRVCMPPQLFIKIVGNI
jgi:hypothetical protein